MPDIAALQAFILDAQQTAAAYARNYGGTVKEIRKAQRVNAAFQQVLDHPDAERRCSTRRCSRCWTRPPTDGRPRRIATCHV